MNKMEYNNAYNKQNYTGISFRLNSRTESDLICWIRQQENTKEYICDLIRKDIKRQSKRIRQERNEANKANQALTYEVLEDLPFNDHYAAGYTDSIIEAMKILASYSHSKDCGPLSIVERGYDPDIKCRYGIRKSYL